MVFYVLFVTHIDGSIAILEVSNSLEQLSARLSLLESLAGRFGSDVSFSIYSYNVESGTEV